MLDDFNGRYKAKRCGANLRGKICLVEIQRNMRHLGFETVCVAIDGDDVTSKRSQPRCHGSGTGAKVSGADARTRVTRKHTLANEIVKSAVSSGTKDQSFAAEHLSR